MKKGGREEVSRNKAKTAGTKGDSLLGESR